MPVDDEHTRSRVCSKQKQERDGDGATERPQAENFTLGLPFVTFLLNEALCGVMAFTEAVLGGFVYVQERRHFPHIVGFVHPHVIVWVGTLFVDPSVLVFHGCTAPIGVHERVVKVFWNPVIFKDKFRKEALTVVLPLKDETVNHGIVDILPSIFFPVELPVFRIPGGFSNMLVFTHFKVNFIKVGFIAVRRVATKDDFRLMAPASRHKGRILVGLGFTVNTNAEQRRAGSKYEEEDGANHTDNHALGRF